MSSGAILHHGSRVSPAAALAGLPRRRLASLPSPLEEAPGLAADLKLSMMLLKRDDRCATPYAGNKVRKLEFLLGEALHHGCDALLTFGAAGSNHALATAVHGRALGLDCHAILTPQAPTPWVADTLRWHARLGTRLHAASGLKDAEARARQLAAGHPGGPDRLYVIPWGGSSWLGAAGFVDAALELAAQLEAEGRGTPPRIYVPCGTMGTVAGLLVGLALAGLRSTVVAVRVVPQAWVNPDAVAALCNEILANLRRIQPALPPTLPAVADLEFRDEFLGPGYAMPTPEATAAVGVAARHGLRLDTTYSGKALACLAADARAGRTAEALFWCTWNSRPLPGGLADVHPQDVPEGLRSWLGANT